MHWPKVRARTATPVEIVTTSVTPGIVRTSSALATERTVPLMVGGRQTIVGSASGTWRSIVNFLRPVTAARASTRLRGVPITVKSVSGLRVTFTGSVRTLAARPARSPIGIRRLPPTTRPSVIVSAAVRVPSSAAAAASSRARAIPAATRIGM